MTQISLRALVQRMSSHEIIQSLATLTAFFLQFISIVSCFSAFKVFKTLIPENWIKINYTKNGGGLEISSSNFLVCHWIMSAYPNKKLSFRLLTSILTKSTREILIIRKNVINNSPCFSIFTEIKVCRKILISLRRII